MKKNFFWEKLSKWEYFWAFILCQRERKRHWVVRRARPCVLCFRAIDHFILGGRRPWVSKYHSDCVRGEICFKEIVSNKRLDLIHSFFMHLVSKFLIILQISFIYMLYIFIVLPITTFVLILLIIRSVCYSLLLNHKSKLLKYIFWEEYTW